MEYDHHLLHSAGGVDGKVMWANNHLLFWLSLVPVTTTWVGENWAASVPTATYGILLFMCALAYEILEHTIVAHDGPSSPVARAIARDAKGKLSLALYAAGAGLAFVNHWIAVALYVAVAIMWLVPDRRLANPQEVP